MPLGLSDKESESGNDLTNRKWKRSDRKWTSDKEIKSGNNLTKKVIHDKESESRNLTTKFNVKIKPCEKELFLKTAQCEHEQGG